MAVREILKMGDPRLLLEGLQSRPGHLDLNVGDEVRMEVNTQPEHDVYIIEQLHKEASHD